MKAKLLEWVLRLTFPLSALPVFLWPPPQVRCPRCLRVAIAYVAARWFAYVSLWISLIGLLWFPDRWVAVATAQAVAIAIAIGICATARIYDCPGRHDVPSPEEL